ncbi:unnamed protein product [Vicia faba]|uniref:Uncharacterized protein n=1 Tax=Vicia faba TaxID=3906 RepID=A0AAV1A076_VICFA|nr:unnamed protein product [Vicia faba]
MLIFGFELPPGQENVDKLEKVVKDGNYYGAQQMYKSISAWFKQFQVYFIIVMLLVSFLGRCYPGEDDLAIARAVLSYLSLRNLKDANILVDAIKKQTQASEVEFPKTDLMQFINFLLQTMERYCFPLFNMLRANFKSCIEREPAFNELLDDIAEKFYGLQRRNPMGMFGDIFKMMGAK